MANLLIWYFVGFGILTALFHLNDEPPTNNAFLTLLLGSFAGPLVLVIIGINYYRNKDERVQGTVYNGEEWQNWHTGLKESPIIYTDGHYLYIGTKDGPKRVLVSHFK